VDSSKILINQNSSIRLSLDKEKNITTGNNTTNNSPNFELIDQPIEEEAKHARTPKLRRKKMAKPAAQAHELMKSARLAAQN
jgi:hypothetical protein